MAASNPQRNKPMKRKQPIAAKTKSNPSASKKPKLIHCKTSNHQKQASDKPLGALKRDQNRAIKPKYEKLEATKEKKLPMTKRDRRLHAKELVEARKKRRKEHYVMEREIASLWEKMRRRNIAKEERSKLISEALEKMKGKISEIASSKVSSRVLQTCVKYSSENERDSVFEELKPSLRMLACNTYAVHLVKKMLDNASKDQLAGFISTLHGHVASLLRHMVGSVVVEHAYYLGNATQKQNLLMELYSLELQLFKSSVSTKENRLVDLISKFGLNKASVLRHMNSVIQPILEKGIVDHSIIHKALVEYLTITDQSSAADIIQQLSSPLLVRMIHTRDGARIGVLCIKHGSSKERKKIIKGMKESMNKIARDHYGSLVLVFVVSVVDDTKLIRKTVIRELEKNLKELVLDKTGRRLFLHLLRPNCSRYFSPDDLSILDSSIPSLCHKSGDVERSAEAVEGETELMEDGEEMKGENPTQGFEVVEGGKKDPSIRRHELLIDSGLAENLLDTCVENAGEFLRSNIGKDLIYEVSTGGGDDILRPTLDEKLNELYNAVALLVAEPKSEETEEDEHILENFHSSRTIRKLILDCPPFAITLWNQALKGKCRIWAQGHSSKVLHAFLESSNSDVRDLATKELQSLKADGLLKQPAKKNE